MIKQPKSKGFTLTELLVIIGTMVILVALAGPAFRVFQKEADLNNSTEEIINALRLAQNKTLASEGASQYGLYFDNTTSPHQYTLFKGPDYISREDSFDEINQLPKTVEIYEIDLGGGESEIVFNRISGETSQAGQVSIRLKTDLAKTKSVYIESSGLLGLTSPSTPPDVRLIDSRHLHFDYSRLIDTATESLTLTFDTIITEEIVIADHLDGDQIYWQGEVDVSGEIQKLKIHTHRLNNPDTQFCVHRDRHYNNQALIITISGDVSGSLIEYSADGLTITKTSIYATDPQWQ